MPSLVLVRTAPLISDTKHRTSIVDVYALKKGIKNFKN